MEWILRPRISVIALPVWSFPLRVCIQMNKNELADWLLSAEAACEVARCVEAVSCIVFEECEYSLTTKEHVYWALTRIADQVHSCRHWTAHLLLDWLRLEETRDGIEFTVSLVPTTCYQDFVSLILALVHEQFQRLLVWQP